MKGNKRLRITIDLDEGDEIIEREIKNFGGTASHVILPAKYIGKKAFIIATKKIEKTIINDKDK